MNGKSIEMFLTLADARFLLNCAREQVEFTIWRLKSSAAQPLRIEAPFEEIAPDTYVILPVGISPNVRSIQQHKGGYAYALDQLANPNSVVMHLGRQLGSDYLAPSRFSTLSGEKEALEMMNRVQASVKKCASRIQSYWIGGEALQLLKSGARLSTSQKSDPKYDLSL
ncbi:MAG: hypothetical protein ACRDAM_09330 [Casimicrobium sp.]